jgi:IclR family pca regulon transcriptional regulator
MLMRRTSAPEVPLGETPPAGSGALTLGLGILELFKANDVEGIAFTEILRRLGAPRSSTFRLLRTLEESHYLRRDDAKRYHLGSRVMALGFAFLASHDVVSVARPDLLRLRRDTGCSTYLAMLEGDEIVYLAHFAAHKPILAVVTVGTRAPAHATAMGRIMLAHQSADYLLAHYGKRELRRYAAGTPSNLKELRGTLERERERGFAMNVSAYSPGVINVSAPLMNQDGHVKAAISAASLNDEWTGENFESDIAPAVVTAARDVSALLG